MSVNHQNINLKSDIKNFINLLQNNQVVGYRERRISLDSDKLSIIYSASQPESSSADKQSRHQSGPLKSMEQYPIDPDVLINKIKKQGLLPCQLEALQSLQLYIQQIKRSTKFTLDRLKQIQTQFQSQRKFTDQVLKALAVIDKSQQEVNKNYQELLTKYTKLQQQLAKVESLNSNFKQKMLQSQNDIVFMKKLVLVANQNYQKMQKKCFILQNSLRKIENIKKSEERSSPNITSRSTITNDKISLYSPSTSQKLILSARRIQKDNINHKKSVTKTSISKNIR